MGKMEKYVNFSNIFYWKLYKIIQYSHKFDTVYNTFFVFRQTREERESYPFPASLRNNFLTLPL